MSVEKETVKIVVNPGVKGYGYGVAFKCVRCVVCLTEDGPFVCGVSELGAEFSEFFCHGCVQELVKELRNSSYQKYPRIK